MQLESGGELQQPFIDKLAEGVLGSPGPQDSFRGTPLRNELEFEERWLSDIKNVDGHFDREIDLDLLENEAESVGGWVESQILGAKLTLDGLKVILQFFNCLVELAQLYQQLHRLQVFKVQLRVIFE